MSTALNKLKLDELKQQCQNEGLTIPTGRVTKADLIKMLNNHRGVSGDDEPVDDEEDAEVIISGGSAAIGGGDGATVNPQNPPPGPEATGETAEIKALKIRLALERSAHEERMSREAEFDEARMARELEFERAKLEIRRQLEAGSNAPPNRAGGTGTLPRDVKGLLPVMSNDDPLAFFHILKEPYS